MTRRSILFVRWVRYDSDRELRCMCRISGAPLAFPRIYQGTARLHEAPRTRTRTWGRWSTPFDPSAESINPPSRPDHEPAPRISPRRTGHGHEPHDRWRASPPFLAWVGAKSTEGKGLFTIAPFLDSRLCITPKREPASDHQLFSFHMKLPFSFGNQTARSYLNRFLIQCWRGKQQHRCRPTESGLAF
jgi:hypothetical protein